MEGHVPTNPVSQNRFLGHPVADGDDDNDVIATHADKYQSYNEN